MKTFVKLQLGNNQVEDLLASTIPPEENTAKQIPLPDSHAQSEQQKLRGRQRLGQHIDDHALRMLFTMVLKRDATELLLLQRKVVHQIDVLGAM